MEIGLSPAAWEKMAQVSPDMFCVFDRGGTFVKVSKASKSMLGYSNEELVGRHCSEFLHPDCIISTKEAVEKLLRGISLNDLENCYIHRDGRLVTLLWSFVWSEEDEAFFGVARDVTELKWNRKKLKESEQLYKTLFNHNPDAIFIQNKEGLVLEVNQSFCDTFGVSREQAVKRPTTSFLPPEMVPTCKKYFQESLLGSTTRYDIDMLTAHNERRTYDVVKFPVYVSGEVVYIKTILKDITETVGAYRRIQEQADKLNRVFESITDAFFTIDGETRLTYINSEAERLLGLDRKRHIGESLLEIFPGQFGGEFHTHYIHALATSKAVHFTAYFKEIDEWLEVKAFPSAEGLSVYFSNVTDKVKAQRELEKLSLVASKTNNGVLVADKDWKIEWLNDGFTRLMGFSLEEAAGKKPSELLHCPKTDKTAFNLLEGKLQNGEPITFEILNAKRSGEEVWLSVEISPVFDESGELSGYIEVQTDITDLKLHQLELVQLTKDLCRQNSDLQQFTYIVSHNLRAPVANALGIANLLPRMDRSSQLYEMSLSNLAQSVLRLDSVLKDMNTILSIRDRNGSIEREQANIRAIIEQVFLSLREPLQECGGSIVNQVEESLYVKVNKAYLYSIFYNLLSNAIKYRQDERLLKVRIKSFGNFEKGALIFFSDNGSGFDLSKAQDKVFKLYKRFHTDRKGRGIGLYLVKSHVEAMEGHIEVMSQAGIGTRFLIYLPKV